MKRKNQVILMAVLMFLFVTILSYMVTGSLRLRLRVSNMNTSIDNFSLELEKLEYIISEVENENILLREKNSELEEKNILLEEKILVLEEQSNILNDKIDIAVEKKREKERITKLENLDVPLNPDLKKHIVSVSEVYGIDPYILYGIISVESDFNPRTVGKNKNGTYDSGLCQINSSNRRWLKSKGYNIDNIYGNVEAGAHILKINLNKTGGDYEKALTGYNTGDTSYVNSYSKKVLNRATSYRSQ